MGLPARGAPRLPGPHEPSRNPHRGQRGPASRVVVVVVQRGQVHGRAGSQDHGAGIIIGVLTADTVALGCAVVR